MYASGEIHELVIPGRQGFSYLFDWLFLVAYLLLRRFGGGGSEVLAAAVSVFGMALAPFVYWSVNLWRTMHPQTTVLPSLPPSMGSTILWCFIAFLCLYAGVLLACVRLERTRALVEDAWLALED